MRRLIVIFTLSFFSVNVFGAYVAPAKDTVIAKGGLGDFTNANDDNGGGATKTAWDGGSPSDFINTNGGPITSETGDGTTYDHTGNAKGERCLNETGIGTGVTVGTLVSIYDTGANVDDGIYEITNVVDADNVLVANINATDDDTVSYRVGGAFNTIQFALDDPVNNGASYNRYIYFNEAETITASIDVDQFDGSTNTRIFIIGYNSTLAAESAIVITTTTDLAGTGALVTFNGKGAYTEWRNIDFNGGGKDASRAEHCIEGSGTADGTYSWFINCEFQAAEDDGIQTRASYQKFYNCEIHLHGGDGIAATAATTGLGLMNCSIHDNDVHGVVANLTSAGEFSNCLTYDNGKDGAGDGMNFIAFINGFIENCTSYGNAGDGLDLPVGANRVRILNTTSVGNDDYGFQLNSAPIASFYFGYNHAYDNDQDAGIAAGGDYCSAAASEALFQTLRHGSNQTGDPKFTNVADGSEDFTPTTGSDLINNGLEYGGTGTLDIGAIQEVSSGITTRSPGANLGGELQE